MLVFSLQLCCLHPVKYYFVFFLSYLTCLVYFSYVPGRSLWDRPRRGHDNGCQCTGVTGI